MPLTSRLPRKFLLVLITVGLVAGLISAKYRLHVENSNKRVEIALEWDEVSRLAQFAHRPPADVLREFKRADVTSVVIQEDTFTTLEQSGQIRPTHRLMADGRSITVLEGVSPVLFRRIQAALALRGISAPVSGSGTLIEQAPEGDPPKGTLPPSFVAPVDYPNLRPIGIGLPPEAIEAANAARMQIAGRVANYPGVTPATAEAVLRELAGQGVGIVIFNGEEVLGYRDMEPQIALLLKDGSIPVKSAGGVTRYLAYGAVEFGKQKGDEKLSAKLKGDLVRVHSIQTGEMGQLDAIEAIDRFAKAARERNIRFCYVRLLTFAGVDPVGDNIKFLNGIARAIHHGGAITGGNLQFGPARRLLETNTPRILFPIIALGVAASLVWMLAILSPLPDRTQRILVIGIGLLLVLLVLALGDTGQKLVALLAGISFPAAACLYLFPAMAAGEDAGVKPLPPAACARAACKALLTASAITSLGIVAVVGLLSSRPYMVHTSQFLGIKAQHAVPLFVVAFAALIGGVAVPGERRDRFMVRARAGLRENMAEPARFGTLLFGLIVLAALALVIARTGNDAGVGVSGFELKARSILDRILPVRPRTKEFMVGHPAFVLGVCWWLRGRRKAAIPAFIIGSLGQVSLLNTFCHIHTPLIISAWRDVIGLVIGAGIGVASFLVLERFLPNPESNR